MAREFDSPWKEALELYLEQLLALLFPDIHAAIDWSKGYESLDKELQEIVREAEMGSKVADKLFRVYTRAKAKTCGCSSTSRCKRNAIPTSGEGCLRSRIA